MAVRQFPVANIGEVRVVGTYAGVVFNEHTEARDLAVVFCPVGLAPLFGMNHAARFGHAKVENCPRVIAAVDPVSGTARFRNFYTA